MELLDFALQMEKEGLEFYQEAAQNVTDPAAKNILLSLAQDEKRHQQVILDLKKGNLARLPGAPLVGVKTVFQQLVDEDRPFIDDEADLRNILEKAIEIEVKSVDLYYKMAAESDDPQQKQLCQTLEEEEIQHEKLMRLTLEFISMPQLVLENAEFLFYGE